MLMVLQYGWRLFVANILYPFLGDYESQSRMSYEVQSRIAQLLQKSGDVGLMNENGVRCNEFVCK